ncbi:hypothetical protein [Novosphingobium sp. TH158]|uniref:hypothetical protein n=1 Tax=Novosphingobium sp. TH158 TaxID=2067455 RepID=UPI0013043E7F|nr:hypothetical protein [Novosphingobium sp. TH158]
MVLPLIDVASLPHLDALTGVFGSLLPGGQAQSSGDEIVILMVFLYELLHPELFPTPTP